jgi:hypothetical protein
MALSRTDLVVSGAGASDSIGVTDPLSGTSGSFDPPDDSLVVVRASYVGRVDTGDPSTGWDLTGGGLTWTRRLGPTHSTTASVYRLVQEIYTAPFTSGAAFTVTWARSGLSEAEDGIISFHIVAYTGYNVSAPVGATATETTIEDDVASMTLSGAPATTSEVFAALALGVDSSFAPVTHGTGWTELSELDFGGLGGAQAQVRSGSTSTTVQWDDAQTTGATSWGHSRMALEIKEATAGTTLTPGVGATAGTGQSPRNAIVASNQIIIGPA